MKIQIALHRDVFDLKIKNNHIQLFKAFKMYQIYKCKLVLYNKP